MKHQSGTVYLFGLILLYPMLVVGRPDGLRQPNDSSLYADHVRYVQKEHRNLDKRLKKLCRKAAGDSASALKYEALYKEYTRALSTFCYVADKKTKQPLSQQYAESQTHRGIIDQYYRRLDKTSRTDCKRLLAAGKLKQARLLQKQSFYSAGKYQYIKKNYASKLFGRINAKNIAALKQSQQFTSSISVPKLPSAGKLQAPGVPKTEIPANLQTNAEVNKVFAFDQTKTGASKQEKFQKSIANPLHALTDTTRLNDTLLFKPNPYRLLPLKERIKIGANSSMGDLFTGGRNISYAINMQYLLTPAIKPVLAFGFEHSLLLQSGRFSAAPISWQLRTGVEVKAYKILCLFMNLEQSHYFANAPKENRARPNEFVMGFTNDTGKKRMPKIWAGIKLRELAAQHASPFVFRVGF